MFLRIHGVYDYVCLEECVLKLSIGVHSASACLINQPLQELLCATNFVFLPRDTTTTTTTTTISLTTILLLPLC